MRNHTSLTRALILFFSLALFSFMNITVSAKTLSKTNTKTRYGCISLTFDDGPDPRNTLKILAILKKYNIKATWFVMGANAKRYPNLIRAIQKDGHVIENHSWSHPKLTKISSKRVVREIVRTNNIVYQLTGRRPKCFRPPFGMSNQNVRAIIRGQGLHRIMWDVNSFDYKKISPQKIANEVWKQGGKRGGDILMHDGNGNRWRTVQALPMIIQNAIRHGQCFDQLCR